MQRFYDPESSTLCYFLINNIGKITQCVDLYKSSWAHGTNALEGSNNYYKVSTNRLIASRAENSNSHSYSLIMES